MVSRIHKHFAQFGDDAQSMIIDQIQSIDLDKIGPKSIAHVGKTLMQLLRTSNQLQEKCETDEARDKWISIRELSHILLVEILEKYKDLSAEGAIPEWERASTMSLLHDIAKTCFEEEQRDKLAEVNSSGMSIDEETLNEMLGV